MPVEMLNWLLVILASFSLFANRAAAGSAPPGPGSVPDLHTGAATHPLTPLLTALLLLADGDQGVAWLPRYSRNFRPGMRVLRPRPVRAGGLQGLQGLQGLWDLPDLLPPPQLRRHRVLQY